MFSVVMQLTHNPSACMEYCVGGNPLAEFYWKFRLDEYFVIADYVDGGAIVLTHGPDKSKRQLKVTSDRNDGVCPESKQA